MGRYEYFTNEKNTGGRVRPKDWMYRVSGWLATYANGRLSYDNILTPVETKGRCCLKVDVDELQKLHPEIYTEVFRLIERLDAKRYTNLSDMQQGPCYRP